MPRGNPEKLVPANKRSKQEASENGKKGGRASGIKRRKLKAAKEYMKLLIALPPDSTQWKTSARMTKAGVDEQDQNQLTIMLMSLMKQAQEGSVKSAELVLQLIGEMPAAKAEVTGANGAPLVPERAPLYDLTPLTHEELTDLVKEAFKTDNGGTDNGGDK